MTRLHEYRVAFGAVTGILTLLVASPALSRLLVLPKTESFSEFWILDSNHRASDYPFNIARGRDYQVFLGIGNSLGHLSYYLVEVKFRNQTQAAPSSFNRTSSSLSSFFNITAFVADKGVWEWVLTFSFDYRYDEMFRRVELHNMTLNNVGFDMRRYTIAWDSNSTGFFGNLLFELWVYNAATSDFRYHERFVGLWFNLTSS